MRFRWIRKIENVREKIRLLDHRFMYAKYAPRSSLDWGTTMFYLFGRQVAAGVRIQVGLAGEQKEAVKISLLNIWQVKSTAREWKIRGWLRACISRAELRGWRARITRDAFGIAKALSFTKTRTCPRRALRMHVRTYIWDKVIKCGMRD